MSHKYEAIEQDQKKIGQNFEVSTIQWYLSIDIHYLTTLQYSDKSGARSPSFLITSFELFLVFAYRQRTLVVIFGNPLPPSWRPVKSLPLRSPTWFRRSWRPRSWYINITMLSLSHINVHINRISCCCTWQTLKTPTKAILSEFWSSWSLALTAMNWMNFGREKWLLARRLRPVSMSSWPSFCKSDVTRTSARASTDLRFLGTLLLPHPITTYLCKMFWGILTSRKFW